ncbi:non-ribosomal peptide synthetase [Paenibacillus sp. FSL H7-0942]|uniref:non-ribosomal peptide synthetase n=1 Tax=Paenibacillus TaxID=44249 RepID=UPI00096DD1EF|nr:non-ribosomal peptide synthetase [Paenibacillus amylolyticus]OME97845.1 hypothetical protein BK129_30800 [Paenibacillus amylolyticus]
MATKIVNLYPLTAMQEGMFYQYELERKSEAYFEQTNITIQGKLDLNILQEAANYMIHRHEIFRSVFNFSKLNKMVRVVLAERSILIPYQDLRMYDEAEQKHLIEEYCRSDRKKGFDLTKDLLIRMFVYQTGEQSFNIIWSFHHILIDGWCVGLFLREWFATYESLLHGLEPKLPSVAPFSNYVEWLEAQDKVASSIYWEKRLKGFEQKTSIPENKFVEQVIDQNNNQQYLFSFNFQLTKNIQSLGLSSGVTLNVVIQTLWGLLLQRYNNSQDVVFGAVYSGRSSQVADIEQMMGLFINTIPVRVKCEPQDKLIDVMHMVQTLSIESEPHSYYPLYEIQSKSELKQDLLDHVLVFENYPSHGSLADRDKVGFEITDIHASDRTNYALDIIVVPGAELTFRVNYNSSVYDGELIKEISENLKQLAQHASNHPDSQVCQLEMISHSTQRLLLEEYSGVSVKSEINHCITEWFESQVDNNPNHLAVSYGEVSLTYGELNKKANCLAWKLRNYGVVQNTVVGLMSERSIEMIVGILGVLKAGGAYVPIDPEYPSDRVKYMLSDSGAKLVLTQQHLIPKLAPFKVTCWDLVESMTDKDQRVYHNPPVINAINDLAYIMYTSGSTGKPKGVLTSHRNIIRVIKNTNYIEFNEKDRILQLSNYCFDGSTMDIYGALTNGATLVLVDKMRMLNLNSLSELIRTQDVSVSFFTTAFFNAMIDEDPTCFNGMRHVLFGGERASIAHVNKVLDHNPETRFIHCYGPTETTVFATYYEIPRDKPLSNSLPIGKPLTNTEVLILNNDGNLQPIGAVGELCIAGPGLAKGYLNRESLTLEKFVQHPFKTDEKMYRTGDLANWNRDGNIEYVGRMDNQVKIRGYRIETGEIEASLRLLVGVSDAVVVPKSDQGNQTSLWAYIVPKQEYLLSVRDVRDSLSTLLPDYMLPNYYVIMDAIPLTPNGKIDKKSLPEEATFEKYMSVQEAPQNEHETKMVNIWKRVLGISLISRNDHFFTLGGHSLKVMNLVSHIHKELDVLVPFKQVFKTPVLHELATYVANSVPERLERIQQACEQDSYPVSSVQKRMLILNQFEGANESYNIPTAVSLKGKVNFDKLEEVLSKLVERHGALRTSFEWVNGTPIQKVHAAVSFSLGKYDLQDIKLSTQAGLTQSETTDHNVLLEKIQTLILPFNLGEAPLMRASLLQSKKDESILFVDMHHIISDGLSMNVFWKEFSILYSEGQLEPIELEYKDYAVWEQSQHDSEDFKKQESFWLDYLSGELPVLELPTDHIRPTVQSFEGDRVRIQLDKEKTAGLRQLATKNGSTLYMVLMAAYQVWLSKYTSQKDIVVGTPISGRRHIDVQKMMGMFVNTLVLRGAPSPDKSFNNFLEETKEAVLKVFDNQDYPFEFLVEKLQTNRDVGRNPLFDAMFSLNNASEKQFLNVDGTVGEIIDLDYKFAKFDLSMEVMEYEYGISFSLEYATKLFERSTIERMVLHWIQLLEQIIINPDNPIGFIEMMTDSEKHFVLDKFNTLPTKRESLGTVSQLFEEHVRRTPNHVAVVFNDQQWTYDQLNRMANRVAWKLLQHGVGRNTIVGLMTERSIHMITGILGVLKAGGAYMPIDPEYPQERLELMIEDSGTELILVQEELRVRLSDFEGICWDLNSLVRNHVDRDESKNPSIAQSMDDLVYILYTSGSTGKPKGVMTTHQNIIRTVQNNNCIDIHDTDRVLQFSNYCFDGSTIDIYGTLTNGATLVLVDKVTMLDMKSLPALIQAQNVSVSFFPTAFFNAITDEVPSCFVEMRLILFGGERASVTHVKRALEHNPKTRFINGYGPTETTVFATYYEVPRDEPLSDPISIGTPLTNTEILILNENRRLQPIGVVGEIYVSGEGLSKGYLNRTELTQERFIPHPFKEGERMYRTGDLAKWLNEGNIEYVGRQDSQVKIRGFRIEPEEVENVLSGLEKVREAVVLTKLDMDEKLYLCAYVVPEQEYTLNHSQLREELLKMLPEYMVPGRFCIMDRFPLTLNGKVDRRALPEPEETTDTGREYEAPRNEVETILSTVWQDVLGYKKIGIHDHFFQLGGDSIKAIQICARLYKAKMKLEVKQLFQNPILCDVVACIKPLEIKAESAQVSGEVQHTPIQQWFFEQEFVKPEHWNQAMMLYRKDGYQPDLLEKTLTYLVQHHDSLRLSFHEEAGQVVQRYEADFNVEKILTVVDVKGEPDPELFIQEEAERLQASFYLDKAPLFHAGLFQTEEGDHLLLIAHHLVIDGVSWRILMEDLSVVYKQLAEGSLPESSGKTDSFQEWSVALQKYAKSHELVGEIEYWKNILNRCQASNQEQTVGTWMESDMVMASLTSVETKTLLTEAHKAYHTEMNDLLLSALARAMKQWNGQTTLGITMEGHGREEIDNQVQVTRTVGWFTSMFPVSLTSEYLGWAEQIKETKEMLRKVPKRGIGFGILKYLSEDRACAELQETPLPGISFNYLGQFDTDYGTEYSLSPYGSGSTIAGSNAKSFQLDIVCLVEQGEFTIQLNYLKTEHDKESIQLLVEEYLNQLRSLINHCTNLEESEFTPSDYGDSELSLEELDSLLKQL